MQRKNYLLRNTRLKYKNGMAMIMAVAVIVIIATIMALSLSLTTQSTKKTVDLYIHEQAILLSKSAAEYALLSIAKDGPCTHANDLNFHPPIPLDYYDINITLQYIYNVVPAGCTDMYTTVSTDEQDGSVLMDITVSVDDPTITSEPIRYFRRSIQKL